MPIRKVPLINGEYYHIYNHGLDDRNISCNENDYNRLLLTLWFYQPRKLPVRLSHYLTLPVDTQQKFSFRIEKSRKLVELHAFALLPNHYHLLVKQTVNGGISTYIGNVQNSYTKYYNAKYKRRGSLFLNPFRSKLIESEEQYLHVSRYIHLNRFSSGFILNIIEVRKDPYTSLPYFFDAMSIQKCLVFKDLIKSRFTSMERYWDFVRDQADYQKRLEEIKHLEE